MRTLIHEVVADIDDAAAQIVLIIHWTGGVHKRSANQASARATQQHLRRHHRGRASARAHRQRRPDRRVLNRNGLRTGHGNRWTRERVTSLRSHHRIPVFRPAENGIEPWLNLGDTARLLKVTPKTLRLTVGAGEIEASHPLPDGPLLFARAALATEAAKSIAERARQNPRSPAGSHPARQNLFTSMT